MHEQRKFEYENQRVIGLSKIPATPLKSAIENAKSRPWTGQETAMDLSKRMLEDSIKPVKETRQRRLVSARENALDYSLNKKRIPKPIKNQVIVDKSLDTPDLSHSLNEALLEVNRNPNIDLTEYLLNNIIKKQGGAPPWIMKQHAVKNKIDYFRNEMKQRLQERLVPKLLKLQKNNASGAIELAHKGTHNRDVEFEQHYHSYHTKLIHIINDQIRGYNLQAPAPSRWSYLTLEDELSKCYAGITDGIDERINKYAGTHTVPKISKTELHSHLPPLEDPNKHYGIKQMFRDLFKRI